MRGVYVDTGLMREGETDFVRHMFDSLGSGGVSVERAEEQFLAPLAAVRDPEQKRHIIGEEFVRVQERIIESRHLLDGHWILGQGTIYPDTIESGGTQKAATIKTHHNRVAGIQKLMEEGRIVEPLAHFYKDEVREIGRELGLPAELLERHPFPGPGLAIRCLCSEFDAPVRKVAEGYILPVHSVGVQGDSRSYAPVLAIDEMAHGRAVGLINALAGINRVVARVATRAPLDQMQVTASSLTPAQAGAVAPGRCHRAAALPCQRFRPAHLAIPGGADSAGHGGGPGFGGAAAGRFGGWHDRAIRNHAGGVAGRYQRRAAGARGICGVFYDLTNKPPATIEWE